MIPVFDLKRQYKTLRKELNTVFTRTASNGQFILGQNVTLFEREFAEFTGVRYAVGVGSGTDALSLGLKALGVGKNDEVVLPANSYPSAFGVALSGATIRLVDVGADGCMDPEKITGALTRKTRAVIPVHLYGNPAETDKMKKSLDKNIFLVEDAAQAHGTPRAGRTGDIGCFSFYPSKNLGALGDAGMVVTNSNAVRERIRLLRMYGEKKRYESTTVSGVSRMDELQAAILRVKLSHLKSWVSRRREIAKIYVDSLTGTGDIRFVSSPGSSYHLFVIRTTYRNKLQKYLAKNGVGTAIHYPLPIHLVPSFRTLGYHSGDFPVSEALSREVLSIPIFPELTDGEVGRVIQTIKKFFPRPYLTTYPGHVTVS